MTGAHQLTSDQVHCTELANLAQEFTSRGLAVLSPDQLGIPLSVHRAVYEQELEAHKLGRPIRPDSIPPMARVMSAPGLIAAIEQLIGEDWAVVPYTHNAPFCSGAFDQQWHKDDNAPYNGRKMRHHHSVQLEMLYYPQDVLPDMGPTATIPYAHYWTFDSEENQDNFAGADHLDFDYVLSGMESVPVSGPDSENSVEDIQSRNTAHDKRMRENVEKYKWPLATPFEATPLRAGSVLLYSPNTFHRGNHRRDDWRGWEERPRFMWRFYLYRTKDPKPSTAPIPDIQWDQQQRDPLCGTDLSQLDENVTSIWRHHYHWLRCAEPAPALARFAQATPSIRAQVARKLFDQLQEKYDQAEPRRIGAAYQLAALGDPELALSYLSTALRSERENVRRAATYGLTALGAVAVPACAAALSSERKWVRKAALFCLGEVAPLRAETLRLIETALLTEPSVALRSVAAASLGCMGRRAAARNDHLHLMPQLMAALRQSLIQEDNRLCMARAQNRSIKFVRPNDDCDLCEGNGVNFGSERFDFVRSSVRENALWSMVMLCSQDPAVYGDELPATLALLQQIVAADTNIISVGFAVDASHRLAYLAPENQGHASIAALATELPALVEVLPVLCAESLWRSPARSAAVTL